MVAAGDDIGQMLFIGIDGTAPSDALRGLLEDVRPGGVALFARNIDSPSQVRALCDFLARAVDPPPFLSIDQEGGRVNRLSGLLGPLPSAAAFARTGGGDAAGRYGRQTGRALRALGLNMDFAPVVDLSAPGAPSGIGDRSFGEDPEAVVRLAGAFADALQEAGVAAVLKHFPGLGPTDADTHECMPSTDKPLETMWEEDLLPFRRLSARAPAVMIAHAHFRALDPGPPVAATLSPAVVSGLLRDRMGFDGLAITDDLEMGAVCREMPPAGLAVKAIEVGSDMVMFCSREEAIREAREGLARAVGEGRLPARRVEQALARVAAAKRRLGLDGTAPAVPEAEFPTARRALERLATELSA